MTTLMSCARRVSMAVLALTVVACGNDDGGTSAQPEPGGLEGTIAISPGVCTDGGVTEGSWFRMIQSRGSLADGPFVPNADSPCGDGTWTPLTAGADGGLTLGSHQPLPDPAFDDGGNGLAAAIAAPTKWFAVGFATSTNATDPQTGLAVPPPQLVVGPEGGLSGNLSAFAASWNGQHFNQGSPKPDGSTEGNTSGPTGRYDPATGEITVEWSSQISGGPFDGFTGVWRLEGTLRT